MPYLVDVGWSPPAPTRRVRFAGFETHTRQRRLEQRSKEARTLFAAAKAMYQAEYMGHWPVRLVGLGISDLGPPGPRQPDLFEPTMRPVDRARERRLATVVDQIRTCFGAGALRQGLGTEPVDGEDG